MALTVLVIDDEDPIRLLCRVNLEAEGTRVLEAENGELSDDRERRFARENERAPLTGCRTGWLASGGAGLAETGSATLGGGPILRRISPPQTRQRAVLAGLNACRGRFRRVPAHRRVGCAP